MIETEVKQEQTDRCSLDGKSSAVTLKSVSLREFKTVILSTKSTTKPAQITGCLLLSFYFELRSSQLLLVLDCRNCLVAYTK